MQRYYKKITDTFGNPAAGVSALVTEAQGGATAALFNPSEDALEPTSGIANPVVTGPSGMVAFAVANGRYKINFTGANFAPLQETWLSLQDGDNSTSNYFDTIVMSKDQGNGIMVDTAVPTYPWHDIIGQVLVDIGGAGSPTQAAFIGGNVRRYAFNAADRTDCEFHIPHDYVPGSDLFAHCHWAHNGTAISGTFTADFYTTYAKGHNQANFGEEKNVSVTYQTVDITTTPRYRHRIEEVQLSSSGGSATLLDSDQIEVDGVIGLSYIQTVIPTITGGTPNRPFVFFIDIHYQSTGIGTKQKAPPFWT